MKEFIFAEFPINGAEVNEYCYAFVDLYGEQSTISVAVEEAYKDAQSIDGTWCGFINDLRRRLCEKGFSEEVEQQDKVFENQMADVLSKINRYSGNTERETRLKAAKHEVK